MGKSPPLVNLEPRFQKRKGIYVLTYTKRPPYKIGMTASAIGKRIVQYTNSPSQHDGHWIHFLLTWSVDAPLPHPRTVESMIWKQLTPDKRFTGMQSTTRHTQTEHYNGPLDDVEEALNAVLKTIRKAYPDTRFELSDFSRQKKKTAAVVQQQGRRKLIQYIQ